MRKRLSIILVLLIIISTKISAQNILRVPKKNQEDTNSQRADILPIRPFKYKVKALFLPDTLGGDKYSASIYLYAHLDSNAVLISIYPKRINLYQKGSYNPNKIVKSFKDSIWGTGRWENITPEIKRYIDWIKYKLPENITFRRRKNPPPGVVYLPSVKQKNYLPVMVHVK